MGQDGTMIFGADELSHPGGGAPLRGAVAALYRADESACVRALLRRARLDDTANRNIARLARRFVTAVRKGRHAGGGVDAFLNEYGLSNREGVILMCLAEALLRIPDAATANRLIRDKISAADWDPACRECDRSRNRQEKRNGRSLHDGFYGSGLYRIVDDCPDAAVDRLKRVQVALLMTANYSLSRVSQATSMWICTSSSRPANGGMMPNRPTAIV